jgi:hypothetical protein
MLQGCKKDTGFTEEVKIPQELMEYFVNYDPGTCWVYQDSLHPDICDTVELVEKNPWTEVLDGENFLQGDEIISKGYYLNYESKKTGGVDVLIKTVDNKIFDVDISHEAAAGEILDHYANGTWNY